MPKVAPVRERGLKLQSAGADPRPYDVAPVRERGLKYSLRQRWLGLSPCRSREGAWIEI